MTEMYSGLIPVDMSNKSRALFYVFQPTVGKPVDEITIWLNGGPGMLLLPGHTRLLLMVTQDARPLRAFSKKQAELSGVGVSMRQQSTHTPGSI